MLCYQENYEITFHSTGKVMRLEDSSDQIGSWLVGSKFENRRLINENEDILITHNIATFSNSSREAILQSILKKDDLLWCVETGLTPLPSND